MLFLGVYSVTLNAAERRVDAGSAAMLINTGPILIAVLAGLFLREGFPRGLATETATADATAIGGTIYLGLAPTALGFATWSFALRRTSAGRTGSLNYLIPLVAIVLGWALLGETPPWLAAAGGAVCLAGVYLARRRGATGKP